jgi:hypothetical protein
MWIHSLVDALTCGYTHIPYIPSVYIEPERARARETETEREPEGGGGGGGEGERERDLSFHSAQCFVTSSTLSLLKQTNK